MEQAMARLLISRPRQYVDILRRYVILVDGERVAKIRRGQTSELELPSGRHRITSRIDWCRSNAIEIEAESDGVHRLEVGSNLRGRRLLLAFFYLTIWRDQCLYLTKADDHAPPSYAVIPEVY
jgi:hypothetical protein